VGQGRDGFVDVPGNPRPVGAEPVWFRTREGLSLRACLCPATVDEPRGTVIVCPGRTEFIEKYFEVARDLQARRFAVLILDWPGQGMSDRLLADGRKGHIDRFATFMDALSTGLERLGDRMPRPFVSLAHSMGGAIALGAILDRRVEVSAAAFCAPMWGLRVPFMGARYLVWAMRAMGQGRAFAQKPVTETFAANLVTHDPVRWGLHEALVEARPGIGLGPVTWGWLAAALTIVDTFVRDDRLRALGIPVFVASAGLEQLVDNTAHKRVVAQLPRVEHITVAGAFHEILMELDGYRDQFWAGFDRMLERAGV
jgi:lysophospholipase